MDMLNMTIQNIHQENINHLKQFYETIQLMQQNIASNDLKIRAITETSQYGPSYSE